MAAGAWPLIAEIIIKRFVLDQNYYVLWTFSDDYASCGGDCARTGRGIGRLMLTGLDMLFSEH